MFGILTFYQKSYDIRVNFVSAQTAQWDFYLQCSFCDKLQLKESILFYFWKPGLEHPTLVLTWQKSSDSILEEVANQTILSRMNKCSF